MDDDAHHALRGEKGSGPGVISRDDCDGEPLAFGWFATTEPPFSHRLNWRDGKAGQTTGRGKRLRVQKNTTATGMQRGVWVPKPWRWEEIESRLLKNTLL